MGLEILNSYTTILTDLQYTYLCIYTHTYIGQQTLDKLVVWSTSLKPKINNVQYICARFGYKGHLLRPRQ